MVKRKKTVSPKDTHETSVTRGSGNVFADLGFEDAEELQVKAELTRQICSRIKTLKLTQVEAGSRLSIGQPDVSKLMNGRYTGYSTDRLLALLNALEVDVEIVLRPVSKGKAHHRGTVTVSKIAA